MTDTSDKFTIGIHALVEEMQTNHGLRHGDYKGYHGYCTRRLSRLRHHQAVKKDLVSSSAYVSGEKKRRNAFCKRELPETIGHKDVLLSIMVHAERAWAHSNELKALIHAPPTDRTTTHEKSHSAPGKIRQHALSKLRRAKQLATQLEVLCDQFADAQTQQEAKAYASWMKGNFGLEKGEWKVCSVIGIRALSLTYGGMDSHRTLVFVCSRLVKISLPPFHCAAHSVPKTRTI